MSGVIPIVLSSSVALDWEQLKRLPRQQLRTGWCGEELASSAGFLIALDPERLWFVFEHPKPRSGSSRYDLGTFVEGLHSGDVGELFVMSSSGDYFEFNLSPEGAWWYMSFDGYRSRRQGTERPRVSLVSEDLESAGWRVSLSVARSELAFAIDRSSLFEVAGYYYKEDGEAIYLSTVGSPDYKPDFHASASFQLAEWRDI